MLLQTGVAIPIAVVVTSYAHPGGPGFDPRGRHSLLRVCGGSLYVAITGEVSSHRTREQ